MFPVKKLQPRQVWEGDGNKAGPFQQQKGEKKQLEGKNQKRGERRKCPTLTKVTERKMEEFLLGPFFCSLRRAHRKEDKRVRRRKTNCFTKRNFFFPLGCLPRPPRRSRLFSKVTVGKKGKTEYTPPSFGTHKKITREMKSFCNFRTESFSHLNLFCSFERIAHGLEVSQHA